ncbi:class I SAM-dependent DNA methyltransferase [Jiangella asiatica]|uniref:Class I SAM-dependent methyltransferase n=1 Tax=Jiangella asiatica TaxID=2530372 RepID=A0A4R5DIA4_9ACTN|nr:class I SAM-dependent methyltransferase [Jiangella asiatica]TDE13027.1 class I SAM-dependent methyltransferase [Jiangella asiatica]
MTRPAEPPYLTATRAAYDTVAAAYADVLRDELAGKPFDRAMLSAFAELVLADDAVRPVADVGCGPGRVTAHLASLGLTASGVDLSPGMIEQARRDHPGLEFSVGTMSELAVDDGALGGVVAWYSVIHTPPGLLPVVFAEFARVLAPGGHLLLAFQVGDEKLHIQHGYGHEVSLHAYRLLPDGVTSMLAEAGVLALSTLVREPEGPEKTPQAYVLARKGSAAAGTS